MSTAHGRAQRSGEAAAKNRKWGAGRGIKAILLGGLIVGLASVVVYLLSDINQRRYRLQVEMAGTLPQDHRRYRYRPVFRRRCRRPQAVMCVCVAARITWRCVPAMNNLSAPSPC